MVCQRCLEPASKLEATRWLGRDVVLPGIAAVSDDELYRAMDFLLACSERVQESVFFSLANLLNLQVDVIFFDTTSTYFEVELDEDDDAALVEGGAAEPARAPLRRLGHSKDHRPDLPQVVIGLAVTREGIPVRVWVWPGNANDQTLVEQVKQDLAGWRLGRAVYVVDSGMAGRDNLRALRAGGGHYIAGVKLRSGMPEAEQALSRQGRYRTIKDNLRVKEVRVGEGEAAVRYVVCHNPAEAERDRHRRQQRLERIEAELAASRRSTSARRRSRRGSSICAASARCATTRRCRATCARPRAAGSPSTRRGSPPRSGSTASTCSPPPTPRSQPRTSRSATSSCRRPNAPSATSRARCCCGLSSTARTTASAPMC
jgi:hypothetical protein